LNKGTDLEFVKEFLLLVTKSQTLTDHDIKIMHSLAKVVHPTLGTKEESKEEEGGVIWTTQMALDRIQQRMHEIGTKETVDNAKEIEEARALGDLRENSEFKAALERRARLQAELKMLSDQVDSCRVISQDDILNDEVSVGTVVRLANANGKEENYTILGPWDADPESNVLSHQSKFARSMIGQKIGESFDFQGHPFTIMNIENALKD